MYEKVICKALFSIDSVINKKAKKQQKQNIHELESLFNT